MTLRFLSSSAHSFRVTGETFTANSTRYVVPQYGAVFSANGVFKPRVQVQYLLSLESPVGQTYGGGWYDAGSYANFTVRPSGILNGIGRVLGLTFFFDRWIDEHGNKVLSGSLRMDSPHALRASWNARLTDWRPILILVILIVAVILAVESRLRRLPKGDNLR